MQKRVWITIIICLLLASFAFAHELSKEGLSIDEIIEKVKETFA